MAYQSIDGVAGDSDSAAKLAALHLPKDLTGLSVLDLGCNEGFFCREAHRRGARRVVGIDTNADVIKRAAARSPEVTFLTRSWWEIPDETFDVILLLSAIHYEVRQRRLLEYIHYHLKPGGLLIIEGGFINEWRAAHWHVAQRHDGSVRFPTFKLMFDQLLVSYSAREMGSSVVQAGDPVPRYVIHARPLVPIILTIGGASGSGKSTLTRAFERQRLPVLHVDREIAALHASPNRSDPLRSFVADNLPEGNVSVLIYRMLQAGVSGLLVDYLLKVTSDDEPLTVIEGFPFTSLRFRELFAAGAEALGYRHVHIDVTGGQIDRYVREIMEGLHTFDGLDALFPRTGTFP